MVNTYLPMKTPHNPLPYIADLGKDADGFSDFLTLIMLITGAVATAWAGGHWFNLWGAAPDRLIVVARFFAIGWLIFKGLAALIDYTIFACVRSLFEILDALVRDLKQQVSVGEAPVEGPTNQRDSAVAYLHDYLKRPRQGHDDGAGPADIPPTAA